MQNFLSTSLARSSYDYNFLKINSEAIKFKEIRILYDLAVSTHVGPQKSFNKIEKNFKDF